MDFDPTPFTIQLTPYFKNHYTQHAKPSPQVSITATSMDEFFDHVMQTFDHRLSPLATADDSDPPNYTAVEISPANAPKLFVLERLPNGNHKCCLPGKSLFSNMECCAKKPTLRSSSSRLALPPVQVPLDRAGAPAASVHEEIIDRLRAQHRETYAALDIHWRLWAAEIAVQPHARHQHSIWQLPPQSVAIFFHFAPGEVEKKLAEIQRMYRAAHRMLGSHRRYICLLMASTADHMARLREFDLMIAGNVDIRAGFMGPAEVQEILGELPDQDDVDHADS
ncbi:hypothetical protein DFJ73DRAFT_895528 [Zopfochytrium polystomum]|nr:hypothetical protein DFJ73DRAFT_895528 [Zopfochytrium polystomum]